MASDEPEVVAKLLEHHRLRLQENLDHQQRMLAYLEQLINKETTLMPYEITVKDVPTINIASIRIHTGLATVGRDVPKAFGTLFAAGVEPAAPPLIVQHDVIDEATTGDIEVCVPVDEPFASSGEAVGRELEGGSVASTVHKGSFAKIPPAYHALTQWAAESGREFAGPPREIYLTDPKTTPTAELITEIQWPLC